MISFADVQNHFFGRLKKAL